jgi:hypothetical protein
MRIMNMIPKEAKRIPNRPLALGEVTGHHHSLVADEASAVEMYEKDGNVYVRINDDVPAQHQEHKPHVAPAGTEWGIRIATEVNDWGRAPVRD